MTSIIIGLTGLARSGKDTVGDHLVDEFGFTRVALADAIKNAALALDPLVPDMDPADPTEGDFPTGHIRLSEYVAAFGWEEAKTNPEVRRTLQRLGSEAGWMTHGEDLWLRKAERTMSEVPGPVVITDIRMPHEAAWVRSLGGKLWRVQRPSTGLDAAQGTHISEAGGFEVDRVVTNDGTLEQLYADMELSWIETAGNTGPQGEDARLAVDAWLAANQGRTVRAVRHAQEGSQRTQRVWDCVGAVGPTGELALEDGTRLDVRPQGTVWGSGFSTRVVCCESERGFLGSSKSTLWLIRND